jgi:ankyrin repeat protein
MSIVSKKLLSQLRRFIVEEHFSRFAQLLKRSEAQLTFDVDAESDEGDTLLCVAVSTASRRRLEFVRALLRVADVNRASQSRTPLRRALEQTPPDLELVRMIVGAHVDLSASPGDLIAAVQTRNADIVRLLVLGARPSSAVVNFDHGKPLLLATTHNCSDIAATLLRAGASPRVHNRDNGKTPLHHAVSFNDLELARLLIDKGASVSAQASNGQTPLLAAAEGRTPALVTLLVRAGADVNEQDPLAIAARMRADSPLLHELIRCGADVRASSALTAAVAHKSLSAVELLLALGEPFDVGTLDNAMRWWVHDAAVAALLFAAGATLGNRFRAADMTPQIADARRRIFLKRLNFVRARLFEIGVALQALELPALVTLEIVDKAVLYSETFKMHVKWNWIVAIKHFNCSSAAALQP